MLKKTAYPGDIGQLREYFGSGEWLESLTGLLALTGEKSFPDSLASLLDRYFGIDHCVVFTFTRNGPGHLFSSGKMPADEAAALGQDYVSKYHNRDPQLIMPDSDKKMATLHANVNEDYDDEYRRHFFIDHNLIDKIATVNQCSEGSVYCNYWRMSGSQPFTAEEEAVLEEILPLMSLLVTQHFKLLKMAGNYDVATGEQNMARTLIRSVFEGKRKPFDCLTRREAETCEHILAGFTSTGISLKLEIAESSVNTYRRRAYEKLGIATQNELFSLFISAISRTRS